jgi:hypothetical protein
MGLARVINSDVVYPATQWSKKVKRRVMRSMNTGD